MSKRVVALINRSLVDQTPVCVWSHEILILAEIHQTEPTVVPRDQLAENDTAIVLKGTFQLIDPKAQNNRIVKGDEDIPEEAGREFVEIDSMVKGDATTFRKEIQRIPLGELLAAHWGLDDEFKGDTQDEYVRLQGLYGMHPEHKLPVVEYVYGRFQEGRFEDAIYERPARRQPRRQAVMATA